MNISIIEDIILNLILILFPIFVYLVLVCYRCDQSNNKRKNILLNIALLTSLYLCLKYGNINENNQILLFCNIPIIIAYMKKQTKFAIILSILNVAFCYFAYNNIMIITIIKYLSYLILYLCAEKKKLSSCSFILSVAVLQGFFLSFEYFFKEINITLTEFIFNTISL